MAQSNGEKYKHNIEVNKLSYKFQDGSLGLSDIVLNLPAGSRTLLIGGHVCLALVPEDESPSLDPRRTAINLFIFSHNKACSDKNLIANGAGKTTLLRLLSGKRLAPAQTIKIAGVDPFSTGLEGVTYLGLEWVLNPIVRTDIAVPTLLASIGGDYYPERRDELIRILDIDLRWRMHAVSDGERRRVQLAMGLIRPWDVLLLDEITVDLDLLSRSRFLNWLRVETDRRGATIVYATHILDNLVGWPTHLVHMHLGRVKEWGEMATFDAAADRVADSGNSRLGELVLKWLEEDLEERGPREKLNRGAAEQGKTYDNLEGKGGYGQETKA